MEITVSKDELVRELGFAQGVLERKSTMPILSNVLVKISSSGVELSASDMEVSLRVRLQATVKGEGAAAVHGRTLFGVVRSAPGDEISMRLEGDKFLLAGGKFRTQLLSMPEGDFPVLQTCSMEGARAVPTSVLRGLILRTLYAVAQEETRFSVRGALLVLDAGKAAMVATDGHRLAISEAVAGGDGDGVRVLVHKKALAELLKLCDMASGEVLVAQRDNHVFFRVGHRDLVSRLMDVSFPSYEKVIPTDNNQSVSLEREVFLQSLRRVSLLANRSPGPSSCAWPHNNCPSPHFTLNGAKRRTKLAPNTMAHPWKSPSTAST